MIQFDLVRCFAEWNLKAFNGGLEIPELRWNPRLRTTAGRFIPARRSRWTGQPREKANIEIATYLLTLEDAESFIRDTMGHEMIHYWLWVRRRPYGHTPEFHAKMRELGVSRYNPVPQHRPCKHCYVCDGCGQRIWVRKKLPKAACAACCNQHSQGRYHSKFALRLDLSAIEAANAAEPIAKLK